MACLTNEQRERIARNKAEADRRKALRMQRLATAENEFDIRVSNESSIPQENNIAYPYQLSKTQGIIRYKDENRQSKSQLREPQRDCMPSTSRPTGILKYVDEKKSGPSLAQPTHQISTCADVNVSLEVVDINCFKATFFPPVREISDALNSIESKFYDEKSKNRVFPIEDVSIVEEKLLSVRGVRITLSRIPEFVIKVLKREEMARKCCLEIDESKLSCIESTLRDELFPYQIEGIIFGIRRRGRLLLADDMGLGKSIQALGIARFFRGDWPLLIVCPSSVKGAWKKQLELFLPIVSNVVIIEKGSDSLPKDKSTRTVVIMSYDMMVSKRNDLNDYYFMSIIFDESHLLKDSNSLRTRVAGEISQRSMRIILLTGTPALSRPAEIYSQIRLIDRTFFPRFQDFAMRYCEGKQGKYSFEAKGCTNSTELSIILSNIMLRRMKSDVLDDLPSKHHEVVYINDDSIHSGLERLRKFKLDYNSAKDKDKQERLIDLYNETAFVKAPVVARYLIKNYFYEGAPRRKIIVFGHHRCVLDMLSMECTKNGIQTIRIDGAVLGKARDEQCRLFQEDENIMVAILSMTAAGIGINLTAASVVIFAELHWNPGTLMQAEDRAHRVGQKDRVFVQYLIAKHSADDILWPLIERKLGVLQSCKLGENTYRDLERTHENMTIRDGGLFDYFPQLKKKRLEGEKN